MKVIDPKNIGIGNAKIHLVNQLPPGENSLQKEGWPEHLVCSVPIFMDEGLRRRRAYELDVRIVLSGTPGSSEGYEHLNARAMSATPEHLRRIADQLDAQLDQLRTADDPLGESLRQLSAEPEG